ncbi:hypothetical protein PIB30_004705 [Stylosanthes scabra]|uniref:Uncharacterized protein n=1 Tax=Stylosanthes scabra TaxID=79078 RepID=A0ABU6R3S2_9FABA|nr:hypothetical protein [Stylosanthes scabra]
MFASNRQYILTFQVHFCRSGIIGRVPNLVVHEKDDESDAVKAIERDVRGRVPMHRKRDDKFMVEGKAEFE